MIMAHPDKVPINDIMEIIVEKLPLKEDYEENKPIFECITGLYQHENAAIIGLTQQLIPVFASVLGEPAEQLDDETRAKVVNTVSRTFPKANFTILDCLGSSSLREIVSHGVKQYLDS